MPRRATPDDGGFRGAASSATSRALDRCFPGLARDHWRGQGLDGIADGSGGSRRFARMRFLSLAVLLFSASAALSALAAEPGYLVALAKGSADDAGWKKAADALAAKHGGKVVVWDESEAGLLTLLRADQPRYLGVLGKPETFNAGLVRAINRATRTANPDIWTDCRWGLITGATAADALRLVETKDPLVIRRALCTTGINLEPLDSALVLSDGAKGKFTRKTKGGKPEELSWDEKLEPEGTVKMFAKAWNTEKPQLLVTSSHATQFNLEMPWGYGLIASHAGKFHVITKAQRNQFARFLGGAMFKGDVAELGKWIDGLKAPVLGGCDEPKVWLASGNCLIGDARETHESMVVSALSSAGVRQLLGYVVPTWYGKNGWGALGLWQSSGGRLTMSEAFFLNTQILMERTKREFPGAENVDFDSEEIQVALRRDKSFLKGLKQLENKGVMTKANSKDVIGLIHDRDVVAFWGDPLWEARIAQPPSGPAIGEKWETKGEGFVLVLTARRDFEGDWSAWLPKRLPNPVAQLEPALNGLIAAKDFVHLPKFKLAAGESLRVELQPGK